MSDAEGARHALVHCLWFGCGLEGELVERDPGSLVWPRWESRVWVCPACGESWLREVMVDDRAMLEFAIIPALCGCAPQLRRFDWENIPGSVTSGARDALEVFETLPPALQKREINVLFNWRQDETHHRLTTGRSS